VCPSKVLKLGLAFPEILGSLMKLLKLPLAECFETSLRTLSDSRDLDGSWTRAIVGDPIVPDFEFLEEVIELSLTLDLELLDDLSLYGIKRGAFGPWQVVFPVLSSPNV